MKVKIFHLYYLFVFVKLLFDPHSVDLRFLKKVNKSKKPSKNIQFESSLLKIGYTFTCLKNKICITLGFYSICKIQTSRDLEFHIILKYPCVCGLQNVICFCEYVKYMYWNYESIWSKEDILDAKIDTVCPLHFACT